MPRAGRIDLVRHLEYFVAIAEEGQIGRAADRLDMAQPPLSQGLQRLERHLGATLFDRTARGVVLTAAGTDLLPGAREVLTGVRALLAGRGRASPGLRIGLPALLPIDRVGALAAGLRADPDADAPAGLAAPDGAVEIVTGPSLDLVEAVAAGRLDAALITHPAVTAGVRAGAVVRLPTRVLVPAAAGDQPDPVALGALAPLPLALPPRADNPAWWDLTADLAVTEGLRIAHHPVPDDRAALALAAGGGAAALTADPGLAGPGVSVRRLVGDPLPLRLRLVWSADDRTAPSAAVLARIVELVRA